MTTLTTPLELRFGTAKKFTMGRINKVGFGLYGFAEEGEPLTLAEDDGTNMPLFKLEISGMLMYLPLEYLVVVRDFNNDDV